MRAASDIADWWDQQHATSKKALDELVDEYPGWFGVIVATATATAMDVGAGMVSVLRLGQGAAEGSVVGFAEDGLRILQIAPGLGKAANKVLARVLVDPGRGICTWVTATKALRHVGGKAFASVDDLADAAGIPFRNLSGAWVEQAIPALQKLGARVRRLPNPKSLADVNAAVQGKAVVLFSVQWAKGGRQVGHTLYAFRNVLGQVRYADRTGKVVKSLSELERLVPGYGPIGAATVYGSAAAVHGPRIVELLDGAAVLAMEILATTAGDPEVVAQVLEIRKNPSMATATGATFHVVRRGESLSAISQKYYRDMFKWPVLYEANRQVVGRNPNLIRPGQRLLIPPLPNAVGVRAAAR